MIRDIQDLLGAMMFIVLVSCLLPFLGWNAFHFFDDIQSAVIAGSVVTGIALIGVIWYLGLMDNIPDEEIRVLETNEISYFGCSEYGPKPLS